MFRIVAPRASSLPLHSTEPGDQRRPAAAAAENMLPRKRGRESTQALPALPLQGEFGFPIAAAAASGAVLGQARHVHAGPAGAAATDQRHDPSQSTTAADGKRVCFGLNREAGEVILAMGVGDVSTSEELKPFAPAAEGKAHPDAEVETLTMLIGNLRLIVPDADDMK